MIQRAHAHAVHYPTFSYEADFFAGRFSLRDQMKTEMELVWTIRCSMFLW